MYAAEHALSDLPAGRVDGADGKHGTLRHRPRRWRRLKLAVAGAILGASCAAIYVAAAARVYVGTSVLSVVVPSTPATDSTSSPQADSTSSPPAGGEPVSLADAMESEAQLLKSVVVMRQAVEIADLDAGSISEQTDRLNDSLHLQLHRDRGTIDVSVRWSDARGAAVLANAVVRSYLVHRPTAMPQTLPEAPASGTATTRPGDPGPVSHHADVAKCQKALDNFLKANPEFLAFDPDQSVGWQLERASDALTAAQVESASAKAEYDALKQILGEHTPSTRPRPAACASG
jgi:hypothetical protein